MSQFIANPKDYTGRELENIFFRPMLSGPTAMDLGIRIMYNMPVPTTLNFWKRGGDVLAKYAKGFSGGDIAQKFQKTINLSKVKAEMSYSAQDYFSMIYEIVTNDPSVNLDDLSGSVLEKAETDLFKQAIAESIRATMWLGDTERAGEKKYNAFDGLLKSIRSQLRTDANTGENFIPNVKIPTLTDADAAVSLFDRMWNAADQTLRDLKSEGKLVILCTSDIYSNYEKSLEGNFLSEAFTALQKGRDGLMWHGIPIKDVKLTQHLPVAADMPQSFAILTDARNMALAVNVSDYPGTEVRMWYDPREMENCQRAIFMAGTELLLPELTVAALEKEPSA